MKKEVGDVTVLVNNAGIVTGKKFFDSPDNMVDLTFKVNTVAHFWVLSLSPSPPPFPCFSLTHLFSPLRLSRHLYQQ